MGCQKAIVKQIVEKGGDYLLALKGNQSNLADEVEAVFSAADGAGYEGYAVDYYETEECNHGRHEIRCYWSLGNQNGLHWPRQDHVWCVILMRLPCP